LAHNFGLREFGFGFHFDGGLEYELVALFLLHSLIGNREGRGKKTKVEREDFREEGRGKKMKSRERI